jgi:hypothetical protein
MTAFLTASCQCDRTTDRKREDSVNEVISGCNALHSSLYTSWYGAMAASNSHLNLRHLSMKR